MGTPKTIEHIRDQLRIKLGWLEALPASQEVDLTTTERAQEIEPAAKQQRVRFPTKPLQAPGTEGEPLTKPEKEFLEDYDLFTPMILGDANQDEEETEPPIVADEYHRPFNIFEDFVETELNIMLSRYIDLCRCAQCRADIVALSLQQLPPFYVTGTRGTESARRIIGSKYMQRIMNAVTKSIHVVFKKPRNSCNRIKQVLWIRPDFEIAEQEDLLPTGKPTLKAFKQLEDAEKNTPQYDVELSFSSEVEELINLMENEADEPATTSVANNQERYQDQFSQQQPQEDLAE